MTKYEVYVSLFIMAIIFTIIDIVVSSCQMAIPSLIFSSITMVIGFIGAYIGKSLKIEERYEQAVEYIRKNFSIANTILSILDVVCCIIGLLTGLFIMLLVFRVTIALRIAIYINKYRNVAFSIWGLSLMHTFKRFKEIKVMTKNTILQNILLTIVLVFGAGGIVVGLVPEFTGIADQVTKFVSIGLDAIAVSGGIWLGATHDKVLTDEEIAKNGEKSAQKQALKQAKKEFKAKQKQDIEALAEQKLQESKNISIAKEV